MDLPPAPRVDIFAIPQEVLEIIFLYLKPRSFVNFCSVTKDFWQNQHRNPTYWRLKTSITFRVPISPLLHADGDRWYLLFKKLHTQSKVYTWGRSTTHQMVTTWPSPMRDTEEVGVIADLQCGGWSTTMLNSQGRLFSVGTLNPDICRRLKVQPTELRHPSHSPIQSFSSGRNHVLGLDEEGMVWAWDDIDVPGVQVECRIPPIPPIQASSIVAGWSVSSAYTREGIIYWKLPRPIRDNRGTPLPHYVALDGPNDGSNDLCTVSVKTNAVPGTRFDAQRQSKERNGGLGQVLSYTVLEAYVVFITDKAKVLAHKIVEEGTPKEPPFELPAFLQPGRQVKDIRGSFRSFSVFAASGEVWSGNQEYLDQLYDLRQYSPMLTQEEMMSLDPKASDIPRPEVIAGLQHSGVISIAYGDYHFHALHADGRITSYGHEPKCCGALGLGSPRHYSEFRGLRALRHLGDATLVAAARKHGREIWFSSSQREWLMQLDAADRKTVSDDASPTAPKSVFRQEEKWQAAYSEWVEREGKAWEEGIEGGVEDGQDVGDGLRSYFAISVAAAGWHSAALILENAERAKKVNERWTDQETGEYMWKDADFPRIQLPDGTVYPGSGKIHDWRGGMPAQGELEDIVPGTSSG